MMSVQMAMVAVRKLYCKARQGKARHGISFLKRHIHIWESRLIWGGALFHTRRCCALLKIVNDQAHETVLCNQSINGL